MVLGRQDLVLHMGQVSTPEVREHVAQSGSWTAVERNLEVDTR